MSEFINNREYRQKVLKELITELHNGKSVESVKARFEKLIEGISAMEISEMEQALIMDGMPLEEVQRLCDVHASVFKGSIEEIHKPIQQEDSPGHPIHTFRLENIAIENLINNKVIPSIELFKNQDNQENINNMSAAFHTLWEIDKHYLRKENLLFPYLEKYGITGPPKVMWGVDDEIRDAIKDVRTLLTNYKENHDVVVSTASEVANRIIEMVFKEEKILFPMSLETLSEDEWVKIANETKDLGFCLIEPQGKWKPTKTNIVDKEKDLGIVPASEGYVSFDAGLLTPEEINAMLNTLPLDITFVDKDGAVKYFSQGVERIFPRTKAIIGRQVQNCHPPGSVHIVQQIVEDLKSGLKEHEDFWIKMGDKFVYIRYYAVRNKNGEFLGTLEVTQNIKPIQQLEGEKRLVSFS
jgi:DUF438 domain-containing protein